MINANTDLIIFYLVELRQRLLKCLTVLILLFIFFFIYSDELYQLIAKPLLAQLPSGAHLIATSVTSPFNVPTKLSFIAALFFSHPYIFYQIWSFISPALYKKEKKQILPFFIGSSLLFCMGIIFSFYIICPLALAFFASCAPKDVKVMTDISSYLDFVLNILLAAGMVFQVPIITWLVIHFKWVSTEKLTEIRPYIIVLAFILGMILTPPDVVSQILLALPIWGLYELGLLAGKFSKIN
ncbi:MAG: Sec-independent protein translocase, TatC subunit [Francisellaceae bacterium]|nr:Sec-independent protein translocase, TatC subunit [Francisellaceae bacterium]